MTRHPSRSWSDKGGRFTDADAEYTSRWGTADPRDGVAYMWCTGHEDPDRVELHGSGEPEPVEATLWDPFSWIGALLDAVFGPDDPHADYRATHPGPPAVIGPCGDVAADSARHYDDHAAGDDDVAEAGR